MSVPSHAKNLLDYVKNQFLTSVHCCRVQHDSITTHLVKPFRKVILAVSICVSNSPCSTALLICSNALIKPCAVSHSTLCLPLANSISWLPYLMLTQTLPCSFLNHHSRNLLFTSTLLRKPVSVSFTVRNYLTAKLVPSIWLLANCICSQSLLDSLLRLNTICGICAGFFAVLSFNPSNVLISISFVSKFNYCNFGVATRTTYICRALPSHNKQMGSKY